MTVRLPSSADKRKISRSVGNTQRAMRPLHQITIKKEAWAQEGGPFDPTQFKSLNVRSRGTKRGTFECSRPLSSGFIVFYEYLCYSDTLVVLANIMLPNCSVTDLYPPREGRQLYLLLGPPQAE